MSAGLDILGVGLDIPPATDTRELCGLAGADTSQFRGWERVCVARDDEHPSTMGAAALRAALDDAGIGAGELSVVVSAGMSRDYLPSWSLSTEIMKAAGTRPDALGIDLTLVGLGGVGRGSVGLRRGGTPLGVYQGAEFVSAPEMNGRVLIKYGGTRDVGHIGPADIIVGIDRLHRAGQLDGPVAVASSTPYSFGFGLITPPTDPHPHTITS